MGKEKVPKRISPVGRSSLLKVACTHTSMLVIYPNFSINQELTIYICKAKSIYSRN